MKHKATITIDAGEKTCASEPGKFCRYVGQKAFGTKHVCTFPFLSETTDYPRLYDVDGWLMRLPVCLETFLPEPYLAPD